MENPKQSMGASLQGLGAGAARLDRAVVSFWLDKAAEGMKEQGYEYWHGETEIVSFSVWVQRTNMEGSGYCHSSVA